MKHGVHYNTKPCAVCEREFSYPENEPRDTCYNPECEKKHSSRTHPLFSVGNFAVGRKK